MDCYAAYAKDINVRKSGSSGGFFPTISKRFIDDGGIVYASIYNDDFSVQFKRIDNLELLKKSFSSKYVQSNSEHVYEKVMEDLIDKKSVLFCGSPCQVGALKKYLSLMKIDMQNLLTIDFICHGVPSFNLLESYLKSFSHKNLISLNMRNKEFGWNWGNFSWEYIFDDGQREVIKQSEVPFMKAFLSDSFLRFSCYECKSKTSKADIRLGDFWGISNLKIDNIDTEHGVSCVMINTNKGNETFFEIQDMLDFWQVKYESIASNNPAADVSARKPFKRINAYKKLDLCTNTISFLTSISHDSFIDKVARKIYQTLPAQKTKSEYLSIKDKSYNYVHRFKEDCCGCMACVSICPKNAIEIKKDSEGFFFPIIKMDKCCNCKLCLKTCPQYSG